MSTADEWNGAVGDIWVAMQERLDRQLAPLGRAALDALAPAAGSRVLDIGCGAGQTTMELAARVGPTGDALGADVSEALLALARRRVEAAGSRARFVLADAQVHPFEPGDAVYSRFGVMFFADPVAAFANLARALRPGGRLAFVCWRTYEENPLMSAPMTAALAAGAPPPESKPPDAPGPFAFADRDRVARILAAAGFTGIDIAPHDEPIGRNDLEASLDLAFQLGPLGRVLRARPELRAPVADAVRAALATYVTDGVVLVPSATWIVTATRP